MKKNKFRKALFMVVYHIEDEEPKFVLEKRKKHWVGWEFPKGGVERGERARTAIRREIYEETGLVPLKIKNHHKKGKYFYPKILKDRPEVVGQTYQLYSALVSKGKLKIDKREHSLAKWVTYKQAMKLLTYQNQKDSLRKVMKWIIRKYY